MTRNRLAIACLSAILLLAALPSAATTVTSDISSPATDGTLKALKAVAGAGTMDTHTYQYLEERSDDSGARVTGSPAAARAVDWGVEKMKAIGLEDGQRDA